MGPVRRTSAVACTVVALGGLAGCAPGATDATDARGTTPTPAAVEYRPGLAASVAVPDGPADAVVVLVPGGGWSTADPAGLAPLADLLVDVGLAVVTVTYGTAGSGSSYPAPADDVACAVAFAADQVPDVPVVAVGHSAGAHLAVLAALAPDVRDEPETPCAYPQHPADGVVGLAGPYDVARTDGMALSLFGVDPAEAPEVWAEGNPHTWADARPDLPVLLVHGEDDDVVPTWFTTSLADDLTAGGHDVAVELLPGTDHMDVILPEVVGDLIGDWVHDVVLDQP